MNLSINCFSLLYLCSFSPLITGQKIIAKQLTFKNFIPTIFYNPESILLEKSKLTQGLGSLLYSSHSKVSLNMVANQYENLIETNRNFTRIILNTPSFVSIINCYFYSIKNYQSSFIRINTNLSFYITNCVFDRCSTLSPLIHLSTRATKVTHICFFNISKIFDPEEFFQTFLIHSTIRQNSFIEMIYSSASLCNSSEVRLYRYLFFFYSPKNTSCRFQCINITKSKYTLILGCKNVRCFTMKMNTFSYLETSYLLYFVEMPNGENIYSGMANIFRNTIKSAMVRLDISNTIFTLENCRIFNPGTTSDLYFSLSSGKVIVINCVFDKQVPATAKSYTYINCTTTNRPTTIELAHFATKNICLAAESVSALGCRDGNCSNSNGCQLDAFSFLDIDITYTEIYHPDIDTPPYYSDFFSESNYFTISFIFSFSNLFSSSLDFTFSDIFPPSSHFPDSKNFTESDCFTQSNEFSLTKVFSKTKEFSESSLFTKSVFFTKSFPFRDSSRFSSSSKFTKSSAFSKTSYFTHTFRFSFSEHFSNSFEFTNSLNFMPTPTQSLYSHIISNTISLSLSYIGIRSVTITASLYFGKTFINSFQNGQFTLFETQVFTKTQLYYIIYFLSPTYVPVYLSLEISCKKKKISQEQLIGIVCGSVATFFFVVGIVVNVIQRRRKTEFSEFTDESSSFDDNESQNQEKNVIINNIKMIEDDNDDSSIDFWL